MQSSPGLGALPKPPNNMGHPIPPLVGTPLTWHVSTEGVNSRTTSVTAVAWGTPDWVLCIVPAGRREDRMRSGGWAQF